MTVSLDRLPFDILFHIASSLTLDDIIHLSQTCRQLRLLLGENTLCRKTIEAQFSYSREATLAQNHIISYTEAVQSIHERRDAFANAYPFSASIVGQGTALIYRQGVLCLLQGTSLRIVDIHASSEILALDLLSIIASPAASSSDSTTAPKVSLLYYSDGVLAFHCEKKGRPNDDRILAISTKPGLPDERRLMRDITLESSHRLFVRHNERYLYYGTYSGMGDHGHHEWEIRGVSLDAHYLLPCTKALQLVDFFGTDIGSTVAFEIHQDWFYAVSNQTSFDVEELDWTSFYHCIRFPLDEPTLDAMKIEPRVYRRQHAEGPIHDSWTDLTLQSDELSNEIYIVESRREWQNGSSRQLRTFYISKPLSQVAFPPTPDPETPSEECDPGIGSSSGPLLPPNNPYTHLVDSTNNPHWAPNEPRYNPNFHPEFGPACKSNRSFILARTKFRAYSLACNSFVDLVEDDRCCNNPLAGPCLRLRVGSRRVAPLGWCPPDDRTPGRVDSAATTPEDDDILYRHSNIKMFPPPASTCPCSKRLHEIMNPPVGSPHSRMIAAAVDERSLVYMVRPGNSYMSGEDAPLGTVVVLNFNSKKEGLSPAGQRQEEDADTTHWQWQPGHHSLCEKGECC
ncbi:hypothetical protein BDV96DRAFT_9211 [Lophiotrema nucula]|uniref:F-box domain-containing protein n=1 Tax=Lophiotrema nucula TaxID=690887 RepID=A0A6A5ZVF0_9PLEO|nr:hypothetical protein BDV96DRAFT_9211 [Lophiotrema nucula]